MRGRVMYPGEAHYCKGYKRLGPIAKLPSNFPRSECRGNPAIDVFYVDELIAKGLGFALQIRQRPIPILLFIRLLASGGILPPVLEPPEAQRLLIESERFLHIPDAESHMRHP